MVFSVSLEEEYHFSQLSLIFCKLHAQSLYWYTDNEDSITLLVPFVDQIQDTWDLFCGISSFMASHRLQGQHPPSYRVRMAPKLKKFRRSIRNMLRVVLGMKKTTVLLNLLDSSDLASLDSHDWKYVKICSKRRIFKQVVLWSNIYSLYNHSAIFNRYLIQFSVFNFIMNWIKLKFYFITD